MAVEREYVGIEPFFAAGTYLAATANIDFQQLFHIAAISQIALLGLLIYAHLTKSGLTYRTHKFLSLSMALGAGIFCGLNGRLTNIEGHGAIREFFHDIGINLQSTIDSISFKDREINNVLKALLSGNRSDISHEMIEAFRASGASHILALSGLHLGIIYGLISKATSLFGGSRRAKTARCIMNTGICTIYTLATGASSSITRALTFITVNEIGNLSGRPARLERILRKSLMIQLMIRPCSITEIGFQLSYAAMAGIAWIYPLLKKAWPEEGRETIVKKIWDTAAVSISCQATTAPIAYHYFGTFPMYFLLTNLMALPLTGIIIPISAATVLLTSIGICPEILIRATEGVTSCLISVLKTISQM